jgi:hypothetical protein
MAEMKSLKSLWLKVLDELGTWCHTSTAQDKKTALRRFDAEGLSFLTITLPAFCKDFEKSLDRGELHEDVFIGWKKSSSPNGGASRTPLFLSGFLDRIFDRESACLLDEPDVDAIFSIRQLTLMMGKLQFPCSDARVQKAIDGYIECEQEVRRNDAKLPDHMVSTS